LEAACKALGISYRAESKRYPKSWWEDGGRIFVEKISPKTHLMIKLAQKISELREAEEKAKKEKKKRRREKRR
jgi:signal recognition particle subunit SRP19